jgi:hypothetical protein
MRQDDSTVLKAAMASVIQADREAAASTVPDDGSHVSHMMHDGIVSGRMDDSPLIQAFARHRLQALESSPADGDTGADLRAAVIEECARVAVRMAGIYPTASEARQACKNIATAIRSLTPTETGEQGK